MNVRYKQPDKKNAISLIEAAKKDMEFTLTLQVSQQSGSTIVRNIYECFRMLGKALLVAKGTDSKEHDHVVSIEELLKLKADTSRPTGLIKNLRTLRHNINYNGYSPKSAEVEDTISLAKSCFGPLADAAFKVIDK